jgi:hypothetical protein
LQAKGSFHVQATVTGPAEPTVLAADLRLKGSGADLAVTGGLQLVRLGKVMYVHDPALTGTPKRPWAKLDVTTGKQDETEVEEFTIGWLMANSVLYHQLLGGVAHAQSFKRGGNLQVGGDSVPEYLVTIDLKKAAAAKALGSYLDADAVKTMPAQLGLSVGVDANDLPRRLEFRSQEVVNGRSEWKDVVVEFSKFGQQVPIAPPPAAKIGVLQ